MILAAAPLELECKSSRLELPPCSNCLKLATELLGVVSSFGGVIFGAFALIDKSNPFDKRNIATAIRLLNP